MNPTPMNRCFVFPPCFYSTCGYIDLELHHLRFPVIKSSKQEARGEGVELGRQIPTEHSCKEPDWSTGSGAVICTRLNYSCWLDSSYWNEFERVPTYVVQQRHLRGLLNWSIGICRHSMCMCVYNIRQWWKIHPVLHSSTSTCASVKLYFILVLRYISEGKIVLFIPEITRATPLSYIQIPGL